MVRFMKKIKNRARRYIKLWHRLRTELLLVAFFISLEMLWSRMDSFFKNGVLVGKPFEFLEIWDFSFFETSNIVDFKRDLVEKWLMKVRRFFLLIASFCKFFCILGLKLLFCWMLFIWLLFCEWVCLKLLKFWVLMFLTSILSVVILDSFTSNSRLVWNITEQITRVCTLIQVRIDCIFSLLELRTMDSEFSWFTILFADMIETQIEKITRQLLNMYILWTFRNNWEDGKKTSLFYRLSLFSDCDSLPGSRYRY